MDRQLIHYLKKIALSIFLVGFLFLYSTPVFTQAVKPGDKVDNGYSELAKDLKPPQLEVRIPGVTFSDVAKTLDADGNISTPFIGEYISGVYKFAMVAASILAVIMIIVQGVQIIMSGGGEEQVHSYKNIARIVIGLCLVWGSYFILYTINPNLVNFKVLKIKYVEPEELPTLGNTNVATGEEGSSGPATTGSHKPFTTSCPFPLEATTGKASKLEFRNKMGKFVTATTAREKVTQIADIADACDVNWGSCGNTAGTINALAGVGRVSCLDSSDGNCNDGTKGSTLFTISSAQRKMLFGWRCGVAKEYPGKARPAGECVNTAKEATNKVRDYFFAQKAAGSLPKDWPDGWADKLKPGDRLVIYNGNEDLVGSHAVIFMGWADSGKMQVVQGGGGGSGKENSRARSGSWCVRSSCGDSMVPLISAWAPN